MSENIPRAEKMAAEIDAGGVYINQVIYKV